MGQKVNPIGLRLQVNRTWDSRWFAKTGEYARLLHDDMRIRKILRERLKAAGVSKIVIERPHKKCRVTIHAARPGVVIGKKGADIDALRKELAKTIDGEVFLNLVEVRKPEIDANLVAESVAQQLEKRVAFRRAMKRSMQSTLRMGAKGCKLQVAGRLGGAEIARTERYQEGSVPLHTLRADIDYGTAEAHTAYGVIGIKTWIYKGEILEHDPMASERRAAEGGGDRGPRPERDRDRDRGDRGDRRGRGRRDRQSEEG
jgi:small subunit ribosomal protein S3